MPSPHGALGVFFLGLQVLLLSWEGSQPQHCSCATASVSRHMCEGGGAGDWGPISAMGTPRAVPSLPADVDECVEGTIQCGPNQMCFNTRGGARCVDVPCPAGHRRGSSPG